jgi:hypothetical protein
MKTFIQVWFGTRGSPPSEITKKLEKIGFKPLTGKYDYYKEWKQIPTDAQSLKLGDQIFETLKGEHLHFKLTSEGDV